MRRRTLTLKENRMMQYLKTAGLITVGVVAGIVVIGMLTKGSGS